MPPPRHIGYLPRFAFGGQANKELGRRVRSWKAAHEQEVRKRKDAEERMLEFEKVRTFRSRPAR